MVHKASRDVENVFKGRPSEKALDKGLEQYRVIPGSRTFDKRSGARPGMTR